MKQHTPGGRLPLKPQRARTAHPELSFYGGLVLYLETRNWAFKKMQTCSVGSHPSDVRMYHSLYFANLLSAFDHIRDHLEWHASPALGVFVAKVENGIQNFPYVRELRNAIVHRGLDPTAARHTDDTTLYVLCPPAVQDRQRRNTYSPPFRYLVELACHCDSVVNPAIADVLIQLDLFNATPYAGSVEDRKAQIRNSTEMPDWAKEMAIRAWDEVDYPAMATERFQKMQELLG